jgi:hypothetical protein
VPDDYHFVRQRPSHRIRNCFIYISYNAVSKVKKEKSRRSRVVRKRYLQSLSWLRNNYGSETTGKTSSHQQLRGHLAGYVREIESVLANASLVSGASKKDN